MYTIQVSLMWKDVSNPKMEGRNGNHSISYAKDSIIVLKFVVIFVVVVVVTVAYFVNVVDIFIVASLGSCHRETVAS